MNKTKRITYTAIISAITTAASTTIYIPLGFAKAFPIQHLANVISAVLLGPAYAVIQAFLTSTLRNLLGTGSLFAYPGSMIGALLAGVLYAKTKNLELTAVGEVIGTGILGAMATYPIGALLLGQDTTLFGLLPAFIASSFVGAVLGYAVLKLLVRNKVL